MQSEYRVQTPESVEFVYELAGLSSRALAALIDHALLSALLIVLTVVSYLTSCISALLFIPLGPLALLVTFATYFGYFAYFEWKWSGQTPGKRMLDLRVIDDRGLPLDGYQAVVRNLLRPIDMLPLLFRVGELGLVHPGFALFQLVDYIAIGVYGIGGLVAFLNPTGKRIGDWAAATLVVRTTQRVQPEAIIAPNEKYNSIQEDAALRARVRRILTLEERETLLQLCLRRNELEFEPRQRLFAEAAAHLEQRLDFPRDPFMSEEKFVQNVTAVVMADDAVRAVRPVAAPGAPR